MDEYGAITCAFINAHEIAPLKTIIEAYLLIKWL